MKQGKNIIWIIALIVVVVLIGIVGFGYYKNLTMEVKNPIATMEIENFGTVKMELYPDQAPETVANFIALANRGFYDESAYHRIVKDFMIQAGSKNGDGTTGAKISDLKDGGEDLLRDSLKYRYKYRSAELDGDLPNTHIIISLHNSSDGDMMCL